MAVLKLYSVRLESPVAKSFRCKKAAQSLDIDVEKKSVHTLSVRADLDTDYSVGLIVGASGSGKTTLAEGIFPKASMTSGMVNNKPIIDQFPKGMDYDSCARALSGVGLVFIDLF